MSFTSMLGCLAALSFALMFWQWTVGRRFPLHRGNHEPGGLGSVGITLLKPLKGLDLGTEACLRSWFQQQYNGPVQVLFAVVSADDAVVPIVKQLIAEFPAIPAQLVVCPLLRGGNAKVSKLAELLPLAKHELLVVSDADVRVPPGLLNELAGALQDEGTSLVTCFYRLMNPTTFAMKWETVAVNVDFWSQVLQSASIKPIDFALGAVMAVRKEALDGIGGFVALQDCLADDYQLGNRIARRGGSVQLARTVAECWSHPMGWRAVWKHQLRWARTIRVCQPVPYFFSLLGNATLWPCLWAIAAPTTFSLAFSAGFILFRVLAAQDLYRRLCEKALPVRELWLVPLKDIVQTALWLGAFLGNGIEWRGERMRLRRDGTLVRMN